ncbi:MAG: hypothetical protein U1C04_18805 [Hydrogenophaga sp.]|uniref:hypothetical protein n=1 Tax=Hydrogenophaga sp. TaxID=1904254 RepID=UPI002ABB2EBD|nr:hypothetical protein [Hydrogenophaga sp.]MDZ4282801.1 hypothetical protein [Hydrogenophaga sp.]
MNTSLPNIKHPKMFKIGDITIGVVTYMPITDAQAAKIAMHAYRSRRWTKKDQEKVHLQYWSGDQETLALLG